MSKRKKLNNNEFKQIKAMLDAGISKSKVSKLTGRAYTTVQNIGTHDDLKAMREAMREEKNKYTKQQVKPVKSDSMDYKLLNNNLAWVSKKLDMLIKAIDRLAIEVEINNNNKDETKSWWSKS